MEKNPYYPLLPDHQTPQPDIPVDADRQIPVPSDDTLRQFNETITKHMHKPIMQQELSSLYIEPSRRYSYPIYRTRRIISSEKDPVTSYAILPVHIQGTTRLYSLFQRRDTIEMTNIVRGLYRYEQLYRSLCLLTKAERKRLLEYGFDALWADYRPLDRRPYYILLYGQAKRTFNRLKPCLKQLLDLAESSIEEAEWMFPRGRMNDDKEGSYDTALREFEEETTLSRKLLQRAPIPPITEVYRGSDGVVYKTVYYVHIASKYACSMVKTGTIRPETITNEFNTHAWLTLDELKTKLNHRRYLMLQTLDDDLSRVKPKL